MCSFWVFFSLQRTINLARMEQRMDQNVPSSSSTTPSTNDVDALLGDILTGAPMSSAPVVPSIPQDSDFVPSSAPTPVVTPSALPGEMPEAFIPVEEPAVPGPIAPLQPVVPPGVTPSQPVIATLPTPVAVTPNAEPVAPQYQVAQEPKPGLPKSSVAAGIAVLAVIIGGVGAGIALTGQNQDVRDMAYVAPATQTGNTVNGRIDPNAMMISTTGENAYIASKAEFPNARSYSISGGGVSGTVYLADDTEASTKVIFGELSGVPISTDTSAMAVWVTYADGTSNQLSTLDITTTDQGPRSFFGYDDFSGKVPVEVSLSIENPNNANDSAQLPQPTQKVANVRL